MSKKNKIDKRNLYGKFDRSQALHHKLQRLVVAKGSDIPWEEDGVNIKTTSGINGWQLMGIVGLLLCAGALFWKPLVPSVIPPVTTQTASPIEPQKFRVTFWGEDGEEIEVDRPPDESEPGSVE